MIRFQGSFTRETLLRAVRLTMGRYRFFLWFFGVMIVLSVLGTVAVPLQSGAPFDPIALIAPLVFAILLGLMVRSPHMAADRTLKTNKLLVREKAPRSKDKGGRLLWTLVLWGAVLVIVVLLWTAFQ